MVEVTHTSTINPTPIIFSRYLLVALKLNRFRCDWHCIGVSPLEASTVTGKVDSPSPLLHMED